MKKNNTIAFLLIALIFVVFYWYNARIFKEQQQEQARLDSLARVEQLKFAQELALQQLQDSVVQQSSSFLERQTVSTPVSIYGNALLDSANREEERFFTLENDLLKVQFSNRGAKPYSAHIKKYKTYGGEDLILFDGPKNNLSLELFATNQQLNTSRFSFTQVTPQSDSSLCLRLYFDSSAYIEYLYTLPAHTYMLRFEVRFVGMHSLVSRNSTLDLSWNLDIPRLEKGYDNEKNFSTMAYKFPKEEKVENLGLRKSEAKKSIATRLEWVAVQQQFFSAILVADQGFVNNDLSYQFYAADHPDRLLLRSDVKLQIASFDPASSEPIPFHLYFGPNHYNTLKSYDRSFEGIVPMGGWGIGWINKWFIIPIFDFLSRYIGNYGLIILILTIIIKIILYYPNHKSYISTAKMRVLKPEVQKINDKYPKKEDAIKKQQETMALYKKTGVNMFGGCLPMLFQIPILFAMFRFFPSSFELRQQGFLWATDLSGYDSILNLPFTIPLYGDHVSLFALLMGVSMYFYAKMNQGQMDTGGQQMPGMKGMMLYFMPIFLTVVCNNFSSGLSYYYMLSNVITMLQTWVIRKYFVDDEKILAQLQAKAASTQPAKPKSKFQQRLDEAYKLQQKKMQEQQKRR